MSSGDAVFRLEVDELGSVRLTWDEKRLGIKGARHLLKIALPDVLATKLKEPLQPGQTQVKAQVDLAEVIKAAKRTSWTSADLNRWTGRS